MQSMEKFVNEVEANHNNWLKFVPAYGLHRPALLGASHRHGVRLTERYEA